jgi:hypothetical protein
MSAKGTFSNPFSDPVEVRVPQAPVKTESTSWIGVDLDGTLAEYTQGAELSEIGEPIELMMVRVKKWIAQGNVVKIFTARAAIPRQVEIVKTWLAKHGLPDLEVTNVKDFGMIELWDDRCVQVSANTGCPMFEAGRASDRKSRTKASRPQARPANKLVNKLIVKVSRMASAWNRVPANEFQPAALGRTK